MWLFRTLGPVRVEYHGAEVPLGPPQTRVVLAMLAARANDVVTIDSIAEELWGSSPPPSGKTQIHGMISALRRLLGRDRIATARPRGYRLRASAEELESHLFRHDVDCARKMLAEGAVAPGAARLRRALARWRGPVLVELREHTGCELDETRVLALEERVAADLDLGRGADQVGELVELVAEHPLRERFRAQLMTALAQTGRLAEALRAYTVYRTTMVRELGIEPSAGLRALHTRILRGEGQWRGPTGISSARTRGCGVRESGRPE